MAERIAALSSGASEFSDLVSPAFARIFTALHSSRWKTRYGGEFEALLLDVPPTPDVIVDVLHSAFRSQRRLVAAGLLAVTALAAVSFDAKISTTHANLVADAAAVPQPSQKCPPYTSIPHKGHGKCALG